MRKSYRLYFIAALLFAIASVISLINKPGANGVVAALLAVSMLLAGIHYRRKGV